MTAVAPDEKLGQCTRTSVLHVEQKPLILVENNTAEVLWEFRLQTYKQAARQPIRHSGGFQRQMWPSQWAATSGARVLSFPILVTRALFLNHKSSVVLYNRGMGQQCSVFKTHPRIHCSKVFFTNKVIQSEVSGILVFFLTCPAFVFLYL